MEPEEAEDVRRLMSYAEETAGAMMTPEPVILGPDATVADALAHVRNPDLPVSLAALVYVCRQPLETPTGRLLGVAHIQRLLREPPSTLVGGRPRRLDSTRCGRRPPSTRWRPTSRRTTWSRRRSSTTNGRLLGAVTVDDLLDHMLPENWRDHASREAPRGSRHG